MGTQPGNDVGQVSGLAQLWQSAVEDYEKKTKKSLRLAKFGSIDEVMKGAECLSNNFNDQSKVDTVRTAFRNNLVLIQKVVGTVQVAGNVASVFPPAMPASLIFTAFGQVMQSFAVTSADYDKIMGFFDFTHRFFDRLSMIKDKAPKQGPFQFQRCVARVFSGMLTICSLAQEYAETKRLEKWFSNLINGPDSALCDATKAMEEAVNELGQDVGLATLRTAQILGEVVQSMNGGFIVSKATIIDKRVADVKLDALTIIEQNRDLESKQDAMMEKLTEQSRIFNDVVQCFGCVQMGPDFDKSFQTCLLKLDVVRLRLTRWGHSVGLTKADDVKYLQIMKLAPEDREQVENLLNQILASFVDAKETSKRYQRFRSYRKPDETPLDPAKELDCISALLHKKTQNLAKERQGTTELEQIEWTIVAEKNFNRMIEDIGELIDSLVELVPGIQEEQCKLCEEEVSYMNTSENALLLLKDIAAGQDKLLSDTIVKVKQLEFSTSTIDSCKSVHAIVFSGGHNKGIQIGQNTAKISGLCFGKKF